MLVGTIEIVMRKIAPSGSVSETVLVSLPGAEAQETTHSSDIFTFPNLEIRINEQIVYHNDIPVPLTHHEFFTLLYLAQHPSWVLSKEQIYEAVLGYDKTGDASAITEHIKNIRKKFAAVNMAPIQTVWGIGYRWNA